MEQPSRRTVLRAGVLVAAVAGVTGVTGSANGLARLAGPTRLRRAEFAAKAGTTFLLTAGGRSHRATLLSVDDHQDRAVAGRENRFTLLFETDGAPGEGIYAVSHPALMAVDLFLGRVTGRPGLLEAVVAS